MARNEIRNPVFANTPSLAQAVRPDGTVRVPETAMNAFGTGRMTLDDVIVKTGLLLTIGVVLAAFTWYASLPLGAVALAGLVGFALAMVNIFKKNVVPVLVVAYTACEGVLVGGLSHLYANRFGGGIVPEAAVGTALVFGAVLLAYRSGKLRATPKFRKVVLVSGTALVGLVVVNFLASVFTGGGDPLGVRGGNLTLSVLVSTGLIAFGAASFVVDFDQADRLVAAGVPEKESWRVAFGLIVGIVFLYLEILRLLSYLQGGGRK